jgi:cytochrome c
MTFDLSRPGPWFMRVAFACGAIVALQVTMNGPVPAFAQPKIGELAGHGGPVRALAVSPDGRVVLSGSFDQSIIVWTIDTGAANAVLRFHNGAVNAAAALPDGQFITGGEDGRIALWRIGSATPVEIFESHKGPIAGLAVSHDGQSIASASWDGAAIVRQLANGHERRLEGHLGNVNAVSFFSDGRIISAGYDGTLRIWPKDEGAATIVQLPTPLNAVVAARDGEIAAAGADGLVRILSSTGTIRAEIEAQRSPIIAIALSPDEKRIAAAAIAGSVAMIDRAGAKMLFNLVGPGLPVWSLAFRPDGRELLTGGSDRLVRRWDTATGEPVGPLAMTRPPDMLAEFKGDRGAEVFRACAACHTLTPDAANRAGPSLHGVFGRRIATAAGYNFSEDLKKLDIVWNAQTISRLFEIGPQAYTPGTKMPEQVIGDKADRDALVRFLERATR